MTAEELRLLKKDFANHVKKIRENKGLSLLDVSYGCSLDDGHISRIENGKINLALSTIIELAKGLDVHPSELLNYYTK